MHMTIRKSLIDAFDENHLWPLITHSSPSRTAAVLSSVGSAPAPGSVIEKQERILPSSKRLHPLLLLLGRAAEGDQLGVAGVGGLVAEDRRRVGALAEDLVHQAELHLAEAAAAHLRRQVGGPQALALDLVLHRVGEALERRPPFGRAPLLGQRLERDDLLPDERAHPVQLRLELGFGGEVPSHPSAPSAQSLRRI